MNEYLWYVIDDTDNHIEDKKILSILSPKGQFAYKAALWQFEQAINANYGTIDAGMLCLAYMRILELEINEKILLKLVNHMAEIRDDYNAFIDGLESEDTVLKHKKCGILSLVFLLID